ncbi:MAG: hypothetical protein AB1798_07310 [Spirochaetota bacterium]
MKSPIRYSPGSWRRQRIGKESGKSPKTFGTIIVIFKKDEYGKKLFPYLLKHLEACRPKDVPQHAEKAAAAVTPGNKNEFISVLERRLVNLTGSQAARVKKVIKQAEQF